MTMHSILPPKTAVVAYTRDQYMNEVHGKSFSIPLKDVDPAQPGGYFFYLQNTGTTDIQIAAFQLFATISGTIKAHRVIGTPVFVGTSDLIPVNRTLGNLTTLSAIVKAGGEIQNLTDEGLLFFNRFDAAGAIRAVELSSAIIVPPGEAIALTWDMLHGKIEGIVCVSEDT